MPCYNTFPVDHHKSVAEIFTESEASIAESSNNLNIIFLTECKDVSLRSPDLP